MKRGTYDKLAAIMEPWLAIPSPRRYRPAQVPRASAAIYVALVGDGTVAYVGSVCRRADPGALAARLREHRAGDRWNWIVVFVLRDDSPTAVVLEFEGMVGRLLLPTQNRCLPNTWLPAAPRLRRASAHGRPRRAIGASVASPDPGQVATTGGTDVR
jgi:hypothetical protein